MDKNETNDESTQSSDTGTDNTEVSISEDEEVPTTSNAGRTNAVPETVKNEDIHPADDFIDIPLNHEIIPIEGENKEIEQPPRKKSRSCISFHLPEAITYYDVSTSLISFEESNDSVQKSWANVAVRDSADLTTRNSSSRASIHALPIPEDVNARKSSKPSIPFLEEAVDTSTKRSKTRISFRIPEDTKDADVENPSATPEETTQKSSKKSTHLLPLPTDNAITDAVSRKCSGILVIRAPSKEDPIYTPIEPRRDSAVSKSPSKTITILPRRGETEDDSDSTQSLADEESTDDSKTSVEPTDSFQKSTSSESFHEPEPTEIESTDDVSEESLHRTSSYQEDDSIHAPKSQSRNSSFPFEDAHSTPIKSISRTSFYIPDDTDDYFSTDFPQENTDDFDTLVERRYSTSQNQKSPSRISIHSIGSKTSLTKTILPPREIEDESFPAQSLEEEESTDIFQPPIEPTGSSFQKSTSRASIHEPTEIKPTDGVSEKSPSRTSSHQEEDSINAPTEPGFSKSQSRKASLAFEDVPATPTKSFYIPEGRDGYLSTDFPQGSTDAFDTLVERTSQKPPSRISIHTPNESKTKDAVSKNTVPEISIRTPSREESISVHVPAKPIFSKPKSLKSILCPDETEEGPRSPAKSNSRVSFLIPEKIRDDDADIEDSSTQVQQETTDEFDIPIGSKRYFQSSSSRVSIHVSKEIKTKDDNVSENPSSFWIHPSPEEDPIQVTAEPKRYSAFSKTPSKTITILPAKDEIDEDEEIPTPTKTKSRISFHIPKEIRDYYFSNLDPDEESENDLHNPVEPRGSDPHKSPSRMSLHGPIEAKSKYAVSPKSRSRTTSRAPSAEASKSQSTKSILIQADKGKGAASPKRSSRVSILIPGETQPDAENENPRTKDRYSSLSPIHPILITPTTTPKEKEPRIFNNFNRRSSLTVRQEQIRSSREQIEIHNEEIIDDEPKIHIPFTRHRERCHSHHTSKSHSVPSWLKKLFCLIILPACSLGIAMIFIPFLWYSIVNAIYNPQSPSYFRLFIWGVIIYLIIFILEQIYLRWNSSGTSGTGNRKYNGPNPHNPEETSAWRKQRAIILQHFATYPQNINLLFYPNTPIKKINPYPKFSCEDDAETSGKEDYMIKLIKSLKTAKPENPQPHPKKKEEPSAESAWCHPSASATDVTAQAHAEREKHDEIIDHKVCGIHQYGNDYPCCCQRVRLSQVYGSFEDFDSFPSFKEESTVNDEHCERHSSEIQERLEQMHQHQHKNTLEKIKFPQLPQLLYKKDARRHDKPAIEERSKNHPSSHYKHENEFETYERMFDYIFCMNRKHIRRARHQRLESQISLHCENCDWDEDSSELTSTDNETSGQSESTDTDTGSSDEDKKAIMKLKKEIKELESSEDSESSEENAKSETKEILAPSKCGQIQKHLQPHDDNYLLQVVNPKYRGEFRVSRARIT